VEKSAQSPVSIGDLVQVIPLAEGLPIPRFGERGRRLASALYIVIREAELPALRGGRDEYFELLDCSSEEGRTRLVRKAWCVHAGTEDSE